MSRKRFGVVTGLLVMALVAVFLVLPFHFDIKLAQLFVRNM